MTFRPSPFVRVVWGGAAWLVTAPGCYRTHADPDEVYDAVRAASNAYRKRYARAWPVRAGDFTAAAPARLP